jgi:hypothetical protein
MATIEIRSGLSFLRHGQMLQHINGKGEAKAISASPPGDMSSQLHQAIPRPVALQQVRPPLHHGTGMYRKRSDKLKEFRDSGLTGEKEGARLAPRIENHPFLQGHITA